MLLSLKSEIRNPKSETGSPWFGFRISSFGFRISDSAMALGIALAWSELPLALIEQHQLERRVHERGGEREIRFLYRARERLLPVWRDGQLEVIRWGSRRGESRRLPCTGWAALTTVEAGGWSVFEPEPVDIPATMGLENGVWYGIRQGIRGLLVADEWGQPVVYMLCEPSSHYFRVMTRSRWMPVLIDERS
jgi:hypothetical protein